MKTRLIKIQCSHPKCGASARMTQLWLTEVGTPSCGCGAAMEIKATRSIKHHIKKERYRKTYLEDFSEPDGSLPEGVDINTDFDKERFFRKLERRYPTLPEIKELKSDKLYEGKPLQLELEFTHNGCQISLIKPEQRTGISGVAFLPDVTQGRSFETDTDDRDRAIRFAMNEADVMMSDEVHRRRDKKRELAAIAKDEARAKLKKKEEKRAVKSLFGKKAAASAFKRNSENLIVEVAS